MGLFEQFPFTNFHQLNLDWILQKMKDIASHAVLSVNGQTGDVVLYQSENIVFPEVDSDQWRMVRISDGHTAGVMFQNGLLYVMYDNIADRAYTVNHPPAYPVTSVDGQTGDVEVFPNAATRLKDVTDDYTNIRRQIRTAGQDNIVGIELKQNKAYRMKDTSRYEIYDSGNQPPYPVTSVNGLTGPVILAIPFDSPLTDSVWMASESSADHTAGLARETIDGTVEIYTVTTGTNAAAYISFVSADDQYSYTKKLLTTDDIPSSSGVVSLNGQTGVVTIYADTMPIENGSLIDTKEYIDTLKTKAYTGDVDNIPDGRYYTDSDYATNLPTTGHFVIDMFEYSVYTAFQFALSTIDSQVYYRNRYLGVWSNWHKQTSLEKVSATGTIPTIAANSYASVNIDVPLPQDRGTLYTIIPRYTSLGLPIAGAYQIAGAPAGYARITVGVFNPNAAAVSDEAVTVDVIFQ